MLKAKRKEKTRTAMAAVFEAIKDMNMYYAVYNCLKLSMKEEK